MLELATIVFLLSTARVAVMFVFILFFSVIAASVIISCFVFCLKRGDNLSRWSHNFFSCSIKIVHSVVARKGKEKYNLFEEWN